jgi:predicted 3-demethylubiquinone-9 3-methyltransferase (glyoxalase superfamily)
MHMQKIQTFLWFNDQAEDAATLYASTFRNSKVLSTMPGPSGKPIGLTIDGQDFIAMDSGVSQRTRPPYGRQGPEESRCRHASHVENG